MLIFWRKEMVEYRNKPDNLENTDMYNQNSEYNYPTCGCDCCHCKKIFMMLVLLILVFIAGIMVGNCGRCHYADNYYTETQYAHHNNIANPRKMNRGMHPVANPAPMRGVNRVYPAPQGGFVMEVDEIN